MSIQVDIEELEKCLEKARYVKVGDEVRARDYNIRVECLKKLGEIIMSLNPGDPSISELKKKLETLEYAKTGDIILPEHHNLVVEALKIATDILEKILFRMLYPILPDIKLEISPYYELLIKPHVELKISPYYVPLTKPDVKLENIIIYPGVTDIRIGRTWNDRGLTVEVS